MDTKMTLRYPLTLARVAGRDKRWSVFMKVWNEDSFSTPLVELHYCHCAKQDVGSSESSKWISMAHQLNLLL